MIETRMRHDFIELKASCAELTIFKGNNEELLSTIHLLQGVIDDLQQYLPSSGVVEL